MNEVTLKFVARMDTPDEFAEAKRVMAHLRDEFDLPWIYLGLGTFGFEQRFLGPEYGAAMTFALHRPFHGKQDQPLIRDFVAKVYSRLAKGGAFPTVQFNWEDK